MEHHGGGQLVGGRGLAVVLGGFYNVDAVPAAILHVSVALHICETQHTTWGSKNNNRLDLRSIQKSKRDKRNILNYLLFLIKKQPANP
jgi:hypothetical protein